MKTRKVKTLRSILAVIISVACFAGFATTAADVTCSHSDVSTTYTYNSTISTSHALYNGAGQTVKSCTVTKVFYQRNTICNNSTCGRIISSPIVLDSETHSICILNAPID
ncbi:MAG: hypothetical protein FWG70_09375 [Oscillospiraceae bacterium]|nr:hypothetical protein [Oscillospiraceae bacterium]